MSRFNSIQLGTIYLTDTGLDTGRGCKCEVSGLDELISSKAGATVIPISGKPFNFVRDNDGAGVSLTIKPYVLTQAVYSDLKDAFDAALSSDSTVQVIIDGDTGTFDLDCKPRMKPMDGDLRFVNGRIYNLAINLVVDSINSVTL